MPIAQPQPFYFQGVLSNYCMKKTGSGENATTVAVLAEIRIRKTKGRSPPPACGNGFETASLPFAKGHVVALELGGSDDPGNVVPQFEDWQGKLNGPWRLMECALMAHGGKMMLVEIGYGRGGGQQSFDFLCASFGNDRLMDWTDERIPDSFRVRVWPNQGVDPSAITTDAGFDAAVQKLAKGGAAYAQDFDLGNAMPQPDRGNYIVQYGVDAAMALYEDYEAAPRPALQRADTPLSWLMVQGTLDDVRDSLRTRPGVTAPEANGFQAWPLMNAWQRTTEAKVLKKHRAHLAGGRKVIPEAELVQGMKRKASDTKHPAKKQKKAFG